MTVANDAGKRYITINRDCSACPVDLPSQRLISGSMIPRGQETHQYCNISISTSTVRVNSFISRLTGVERFCTEEDGGGSCGVKITPILAHTASDSPGFFRYQLSG